MPELPDLTVYLDALAARAVGRVLTSVEVLSPFVLRSVEPPVAACHGRRVVALRRLEKRIVLALEGRLFVAIHLMVAGRLQWRPGGLAAAAGRGARSPRLPRRPTPSQPETLQRHRQRLLG